MDTPSYFQLLLRSLNMAMADTAECIKVAVRCRPLAAKEHAAGYTTNAWSLRRLNNDACEVTANDDAYADDASRLAAGHKQYVVDHVVLPSQTTESCFEELASELVVGAINGINGTIFAYGQTASGKTHTLMGDDERPGLLPLTLLDLFDRISDHDGDTDHHHFLIALSYIEPVMILQRTFVD